MGHRDVVLTVFRMESTTAVRGHTEYLIREVALAGDSEAWEFMGPARETNLQTPG